MRAEHSLARGLILDWMTLGIRDDEPLFLNLLQLNGIGR
jgi:hypothetical protein